MTAKKFQVFVSSTYTDLIPERQAVVEAILMAGHIPAGMELFAAGDKSQLEVIRRWIKDSDLYMLILGGRYGSIETDSGKSYIQLEYEYALELKKPVFAAVISDTALENKVGANPAAQETDHKDLYQAFRAAVLSRICRFFDDYKDVKLIVHESIPEITRGRDLPGWIRGDQTLDAKKTLADLSAVHSENARLTKRIAELEKKVASDTFGEYTYEELTKRLEEAKVNIDQLTGGKTKEAPLFNVFMATADDFAVGVSNYHGMTNTQQAEFFTVAPKLFVYGLVEKQKVAGAVGVQRFQLSALGTRYLARAKPEFDKLVAAAAKAPPKAVVIEAEAAKKSQRRRKKPSDPAK
jgi:hypothetical protein